VYVLKHYDKFLPFLINIKRNDELVKGCVSHYCLSVDAAEADIQSFYLLAMQLLFAMVVFFHVVYLISIVQVKILWRNRPDELHFSRWFNLVFIQLNPHVESIFEKEKDNQLLVEVYDFFAGWSTNMHLSKIFVFNFIKYQNRLVYFVKIVQVFFSALKLPYIPFFQVNMIQMVLVIVICNGKQILSVTNEGVTDLNLLAFRSNLEAVNQLLIKHVDND